MIFRIYNIIYTKKKKKKKTSAFSNIVVRHSLIYFLCIKVVPLYAFSYIQHYLYKKKKID
jgi:hypothetical protein